MKKLLTVLCAVACVGTYSSESLAKGNPGHDRTDKQRQHRQNQRINRGVRSGELTNEEARNLREQQRELREDRRELRQDRREAWADGSMSVEERDALRTSRAQLQEERDLASERIYKQKHDGDVNENRQDDED